MIVVERDFHVPCIPGHRGLLSYFSDVVRSEVRPHELPVRFVVTATENGQYHCELGVLQGTDTLTRTLPPSIFEFKRRPVESIDKFNVVMLVPTGVGAEIGGHAGDAGSAARLLAGACDQLITHPNVVNASDINELPENGLYVEGSVICRLLMGTAGLAKVRSNRVLFICDQHEDESFTDAAVNSLNAARACYGLNCPRIVELHPSVGLKAIYTNSGRAGGQVDNIEAVLGAMEKYRNEYDAVALASVISVPHEWHEEYFASDGSMVNPWGGVEAIFTHTLSLLCDVPTAHSPMLESHEIEAMEPGIVDPRMAAEAVSYTFLQCIFKGLQRSPRIVTAPEAMAQQGVITASDVSCLVIPEGCVGLPVLAALEQGITVIAVRENKNLMRNDTAALPWAPGQYIVVENYLEAAGMLTALKAGVAIESVRRPLQVAKTEIFGTPRVYEYDDEDEQEDEVAVHAA
jgi:hypothetical protein